MRKGMSSVNATDGPEMRMCSNPERPSVGSYLDNLRTPMPLRRKVLLLVRNLARRIVPRPATCCGHPGEPGC